MNLKDIKQPTNLDECLEILPIIISPEGCKEFAVMKEEEVNAVAHHGLGRMLRNDWKLWQVGSIMYEWFAEKGITHADDMSGIIITSWHRQLNNLPIKLEDQIKFYQDYWKQHELE